MSEKRVPKPGDDLFVRLSIPSGMTPGARFNYGPFPAKVVSARLDVISACVFVDSSAPIAYKGPVLGVEDCEPFDASRVEAGGWSWTAD